MSAKNDFRTIKAWDFNCEPKEIDGKNFCEVSPIPINLNCTGLSMTDVDEIVENHGKDDCCCNSGGLFHDSNNNCWFTGSRKVAEELVKKGATIGKGKIRHFVRV